MHAIRKWWMWTKKKKKFIAICNCNWAARTHTHTHIQALWFGVCWVKRNGRLPKAAISMTSNDRQRANKVIREFHLKMWRQMVCAIRAKLQNERKMFICGFVSRLETASLLHHFIIIVVIVMHKVQCEMPSEQWTQHQNFKKIQI